MLTVGVTFFLQPGRQSIWSNGITQHAVFLWQLLGRLPGVDRVYAINAGHDVPPHPALMLGPLGVEFVRLEQVIDQLDLLVEVVGQVEATHVERVRARGGRAVAYKLGNAWAIDAERIIHGKPSGAIYNGARFDEVWTTPQHARSCGPMWQTTYRCPVRVLPHVWMPTFVNQATAEFPPGLHFGYLPGRAKKRIAVLEPNTNLIKTCLIPMLACEEAYRARPDLVDTVLVANAREFANHVTFRHLFRALDIGRDEVAAGGTVCSVEDRFAGPWLLAKHADAVVAHQVENGLNFAYYEALYGGYPLVHNSELLPAGVGYYYPGFDCVEGGRVLVEALERHDEELAAYRDRADEFLDSVLASDLRNLGAHAEAIAAVFARPSKLTA